MKFSSMRQFYGSKSVEGKKREGRTYSSHKMEESQKRVKPVFVGQEVPLFIK